MWLVILSDQLPVVGLVSRYLTNYLIGRRLLPERLAALVWSIRINLTPCGISDPFEPLFPTPG